MTFEEFKEEFNIRLNPQQEAALTSVEGQTLLLAVPGSGKTTTLVCRVGYMIYVRGIDPSKILVMTFTRAAARDMVGRFTAIFGGEYAGRLRFRTINALCYYTVNRYCQVRSQRKPQMIDDNYRLLFRLYQDVYSTYPAESDIRGMQLAITRAKNLQLSDDRIRKMQVDDKQFAPLYAAYQKHLRRNWLMDFDDQLVYTHRILTQDPEFLEHLQDDNPYILVDEAQDTSLIQHRIIDILASKYGNLFMVGDEDQSIYGFRAAYPEALMDFGRKYPGATILKLEQNYRSTPEIVKLANVFIRLNKKRYAKKMFTERVSMAKVRFLRLKHRDDQYRALTKLVLPQYEGETAVIYRNNESAIPLIAELMKNNVPFRCRGMDNLFFGSRVVADLKNILMSALKPFDAGLFMKTYSLFNAHIPRKAAEFAAQSVKPGRHRSIWHALYFDDDVDYHKYEILKISKGLGEIAGSRNVKDAIRQICDIGYNRADDDRVYIMSTLAEDGESINAFLSRLDELAAAMETAPNRLNAPYILTTIHSAKGLEYDNVIIMDEISPVFPDVRASIEEERRLFYVAMTRAKDNLVLLSYGDEKQPFIDKIEKACLPEKGGTGKGRTGKSGTGKGRTGKSGTGKGRTGKSGTGKGKR